MAPWLRPRREDPRRALARAGSVRGSTSTASGGGPPPEADPGLPQAKPIYPYDGYRTVDKSQHVDVQVITAPPGEVNYQLVVQFDVDANFLNLTGAQQEILTTGLSHLDIVSTPPNTPLGYSTWYWRAQVKDEFGVVVSPWSSAKWFDVLPVAGTSVAYIESNIGASVPTSMSATVFCHVNVGMSLPAALKGSAYVESNIGASFPETLNGFNYLQVNIGAVIAGTPDAGRYYVESDVTEDAPTPVIWWIRPEQGREGWVFHIFGHGFGASRAEYDGRVFLGDLEASSTIWETVPAEDDGYLRADFITLASVLDTYSYNDISSVADYVVQAGDRLSYEVLWRESYTFAAIDLVASDQSQLRDESDAEDQLGLHASPPTDISSEAHGQWFTRVIELPASWVGKTITEFLVSSDCSTAGVSQAFFRDVMIADLDGNLQHAIAVGSTAVTIVDWDSINSTLLATTVTAATRIMKNPEKITSEHGHLVVVVPSGAKTDFVRVELNPAP